MLRIENPEKSQADKKYRPAGRHQWSETAKQVAGLIDKDGIAGIEIAGGTKDIGRVLNGVRNRLRAQLKSHKNSEEIIIHTHRIRYKDPILSHNDTDTYILFISYHPIDMKGYL